MTNEIVTSHVKFFKKHNMSVLAFGIDQFFKRGITFGAELITLEAGAFKVRISLYTKLYELCEHCKSLKNQTPHISCLLLKLFIENLKCYW